MLDELHSDDLEQLHKKRELLEQLLAFTKQINQVANGLDLVREIAKPSQRVNKKLFKLLLALIQRLEPLDTEELRERLTTMDAQVHKELSRMMVLSRMSEEEFLQHFGNSCSKQLAATYDALLQEIDAFRRMAQTNVAIRYILTQRGALLDACSLPISQEKLGETVETLRVKETECRKKVEAKVKDMIADTDALIACDKYPQELKTRLISIRVGLAGNLQRLQDGESVSDVFVSIDAFEISDDTAEPEPAPAEEFDNSAVATRASEAEKPEVVAPETPAPVERAPEKDLSGVPKSFLGIVLLAGDVDTWLRSPWQVSWRSIRAKSRLRSRQIRRGHVHTG